MTTQTSLFFKRGDVVVLSPIGGMRFTAVALSSFQFGEDPLKFQQFLLLDDQPGTNSGAHTVLMTAEAVVENVGQLVADLTTNMVWTVPSAGISVVSDGLKNPLTVQPTTVEKFASGATVNRLSMMKHGLSSAE